MNGSKLFQIREEDLGELERVLPQLAESMITVMSNRDRVHLRRLQTIVSNVRWNYGPPTNVEVIPCDGDQPTS